MDKLTRLFVNRLRQDAHRRTLRNALLNGLIELKLVEHDGHLLKRFSPAFDTSQLSGNVETDVAWIRKHFAAFLVEPPKVQEPHTMASAARGIPVDVLPSVPERLKVLFQRKLQTAPWSVADEARRAYAVRLVAAAGEAPATGHLITAILLARAFARTGRAMSDWMQILRCATSIICVKSEIEAFERHFLRLAKHTGLLPGDRLALIEGGVQFRVSDLELDDHRPYRSVIHLDGRDFIRLTSPSLSRRMVDAAARDLPVLVTADHLELLPDKVLLASDLTLVVPKPNLVLIEDVVDTIFGAPVLDDLQASPVKLLLRWLTLEDLIIAFRPGRRPSDAIKILAALAKHNRQDAGEDDEADERWLDDELLGKALRGKQGGHEDDATPEVRSNKPTVKDRAKSSAEKERRLVTVDPSKQSFAGKRAKPSGAEVIQPDPAPNVETRRAGTRLSVETVSGYGRAKDWALDLKSDFQEYLADRLDWEDMSTRLLLSGPPGTGKTTFARALCNSLQIPLVVTSVATWLEGGHLNDVIRRMAKTFEEARELAPCILFIDEVDGVGKRQPAEREYADYWNAVVNRALELLDGAAKSEGVIIVGATNRPMEIDEALRRSGRLDTHIEIPRPDIPALADILAFHLGKDVELLKSDQPVGSSSVAQPRPPNQPDQTLDRKKGVQP